jgi:putative nucleotide binding protein
MSERNTRNQDRSSSYQKKPDNFRSNYRSDEGASVDKQRKYEEYAWTLAYLSEGSPTDPNPFSQREPVIQALGEIWFTLLELTPKRGVNIEPLVRIGIGKDNRKVINRIKRRIGFDDLASSSERVLEDCIIEIVNKQEFRFVNWFNKASLVTSRMHSFKLLPGIGTTHLENLISERTKVNFTSFEDIASRTKVSDPRKLIIARIMKELTNIDEKYRLFTRKP